MKLSILMRLSVNIPLNFLDHQSVIGLENFKSEEESYNIKILKIFLGKSIEISLVVRTSNISYITLISNSIKEYMEVLEYAINMVNLRKIPADFKIKKDEAKNSYFLITSISTAPIYYEYIKKGR